MRTGAGAGESLHAFNPRMYAIGTERCPVSIFKNYIQKRPQQACKPDSPLYLSVANSVTNDSATWYKNQPVGKVTLGKFMKNMAERAGLEGYKTNHSIRRLVEKNVNPLHVAHQIIDLLYTPVLLIIKKIVHIYMLGYRNDVIMSAVS